MTRLFDVILLACILAAVGVNVYGIFYHDRWKRWYRFALFFLTTLGLLTIAGALYTWRLA